MAAAGPASLGTTGRTVGHFVGIALGWSLFVFGWIRVAARPWDAYELWVLIVASLIVLPTLTAIWILHNVASYRGRHRRREASIAEFRYEVDWAGRAVEADWDALGSAGWIRIDVGGGTKRYRTIVPVSFPNRAPTASGRAGLPASVDAGPAS